MGVSLIAGRDFAESDTTESDGVVIANEKAARTLWPGRDPIGQIVQFGRERRVVGVVANVRHLALEHEGGREGYIPLSQAGSGTVDLVVRSTNEPENLIPSVRRVLQSADPEMPAGEFQKLGELVERSVSPRRFLTIVLGGFAAGALLPAVIGIYGVVSCNVGRRLQEIGIRMALGASPGEMRRKIVLDTVRLVSCGLLIGVTAALALTRLDSSLLFNVGVTDPIAFAGTIAILLVSAVLAGFVAAFRASRLDPVTVLRAE